MTFSISDLDQYKMSALPTGYPPNVANLYAPVDNVHGALVAILKSAQHSLVCCMYGFNDPELASILTDKLADEHVFVQLSLDSTQAGGVHEKQLLAQEDYPSSSIAIGQSEKHAIMHLKMLVVDSAFTVTGSTNWGVGAETKQDNSLVVIADLLVAAEARTRADIIHAHMLQQQTKALKASLLDSSAAVEEAQK